MEKLEVLCATMHQKDFQKLEEMNLSSDVVFANQDDTTSFQQITYGDYTAKMITTQTRGVGRNRNLALLYATGDILLFADDDIHYAQDYHAQVLAAFAKWPDADVIIFSMDFTRDGTVFRRRQNKDRRISIRSGLRYGAASCAIRRSSLERHTLWFSTMYGGGAKYGHGEDTEFLVRAFRNRLRVYTSSYCLGQTATDTSTWFTGYDEKYFYDQGALYAALFGPLALPMGFQFCIRKRKRFQADISLEKALAMLRQGIKEWKKRE